MASKQILEIINRVKQEVDKNGWDIRYADAYYQYGLYLKDKEKDIDMAMKCFTVAKRGYETIGYNQTGGDMWQIEKYCMDNGLKIDIVENWYKCLLEESYYKFESFIFYLEKNRPQSKRFYLPRRKTLRVVCQDLQDLEDDKYKFYGLSMPSRTGKLISDDTPVLTEKGWKNHGDLEVGDYVYDFEGQLVKVLYIHPKNEATKRVWFTDNTYIDCHPNHEWILYDRNMQSEYRVETKFVEKNIKSRENGKVRNRWYLPQKKILNGEYNNSLKVPPYVLGAWLGDGTNRKPTITICDTDIEILNTIEGLGYKHTASHKQVGCRAYSFEGLRKDLQEYGMCMKDYATQKHIPDEYMTAHPSQRLELLAGLLDTDGTLVKKEHRYHYSTIDERLKDDVVSLVSSFGWRVCVSEQEPKTSTSGIVGKHKVYIVSFNPTLHIPCKVERKKLFEFSKRRRIAVDRIEDIEPKSGNCITVEGGIYRVGRRMIPTHNSTICILFLCWIGLRKPNSHNAMGGHSGILAKGFHKELLNIIDTDEYTFKEMFAHFHPNHVCLRDKSAEEFTITLDESDRFATFTCRGIDGTWTGAVDISGKSNGVVDNSGYLYVDDLVRDREHSLSPTRMENTFQEYLNKMVDRKNDGAKELMVGTLWNVLDPLERLRIQYENEEGYFFRRLSALDENDESNFDYDISGFSTQYYREMRERLDDAEWMAKYQQKPYVREGILMPKDELNYFNGIIPEGDYRILAPCDVAYGGGDSLSMPIGYEFDNGDVYIVDWVFNKGAKETTIPLVTGKIIENQIRRVRFEGNQGGDMYADYIDKELHNRGWKCAIESKKAPNTMAKTEKIIAYSGDIKRKYYFLQEKRPTEEQLRQDKELGIKRFVRSKEYQTAMDEMCTFVTVGKNIHEDAIDSITQMEMMIEETQRKTVKIIKGLM